MIESKLHGLESLKTDQYMAKVIDIDDPERCGRCRVRVFHLMDDENSIPDEYLPWATPKFNASFGSHGGGSLSIPKVGTIVGVEFNCGDLYSPEYYGISNADAGTVNNISGDYKDTNVLAEDSDNAFSLAFQKARGFFAHLKGSIFGINPDSSITLSHKDGSSNLEMKDSTVNLTSNNDINIGGQTNKTVSLSSNVVKIDGSQGIEMSGSKTDEYAVNGKALLSLLTAMAKLIDTKMPASPGAAETLVNSQKYSILNNKIKYK